jgi:hypothetical protein
MNTSEKLASARWLGVAAHARGLPRKPILDIDNLKELFHRKQSSIEVMESWLQGWDNAAGRIPHGPIHLLFR